MRWTNKAPRSNQEKIILDFAIFPVKVGTTWVWLERYWQVLKSNGNHHWFYAQRYLYEDLDRNRVKEINSKVKYVDI